MREFYHKMRQLLQIATILLQNVTVITKCDVYYKFDSTKHNGKAKKIKNVQLSLFLTVKM